jgi:CheY-like chemotaxis protein
MPNSVCSDKKEMRRAQKEILVVDDEADLCELIKEYLEEDEAIIVSSSVNPSDALELMEKKSFDLVITDMHMPDFNGITFIKKARQIECQADTKFVVTTGGSFSAQTCDDEERAFLKDKIDGYLMKPFDQDKLIKLVRSLLSPSR